MGRTKGVKLTEEVKASIRAKREARRLAGGKSSVFGGVISSLKHLSFEELDKLIALADLQKLKKADDEKQRLMKEKHEIESQLQKLEEMKEKA
ncbi:MAG: hypothetical protein LBU03_00725 [Tannerellaceae bacterium]|jgi:hypothetical protein|nr:hypothetical protein [Tannerellaceae bacterium]